MRKIEPIGGGCGWEGGEKGGSPRWQRRVTPAQLAADDDALAAATARGMRWEEMTQADFPLPSFALLAEDIRAELEEGSGILLLRGLLLRGLDPGRYTPDQLKILYAGLCRHIGTPVYS